MLPPRTSFGQVAFGGRFRSRHSTSCFTMGAMLSIPATVWIKILKIASDRQRLNRVALVERPIGQGIPSRKGPIGQAAQRLWRAEKHRACGLARSANRCLTRRGCLSVESAANAASSATGPQDRASQGSRRAATTATVKRRSLPNGAFAAPDEATVIRAAQFNGHALTSWHSATAGAHAKRKRQTA